MGNPATLKPFQNGFDPRRTLNSPGRKPKKIITDLLVKELQSGKEEVIIEGFDVVTGNPTKIKVPMPTLKNVVQSLLRQAKRGNVKAIEIILERVEGRVPQPIEGEFMVPIQFNFNMQSGNDPIQE